MQHIDAQQIDDSLSARISYMQTFLSFDPKTDGDLIHATQPVLAPIVNNIVDAVYDHLLKFDITAASFAPAQSAGQQSVQVQELNRDHANITFRKHFLKAYLIKLASNEDWSPDSKLWAYLDAVGKAHTGVTGEESGLKHRKHKPPLYVNYRECSLLLGWVETAVVDIVMGVESLDVSTRVKIVKALSKFWWIQNDLFARHYMADQSTPGENDGGASGIWAVLGWGNK